MEELRFNVQDKILFREDYPAGYCSQILYIKLSTETLQVCQSSADVELRWAGRDVLELEHCTPRSLNCYAENVSAKYSHLIRDASQTWNFRRGALGGQTQGTHPSRAAAHAARQLALRPIDLDCLSKQQVRADDKQRNHGDSQWRRAFVVDVVWRDLAWRRWSGSW